MHLTGSLYHPATSGAAEKLVKTFKRFLEKSRKSHKEAFQKFLMQYRRSPLASGYSPSELLNYRQIRTKTDTLLLSPAHKAQERQALEATKSQVKHLQSMVHNVHRHYQVGAPCYALYCGPRRTSAPSWVPATVIKVHGSRSVNVKVHPRGSIWRRHSEQLRPRYGVDEYDDPGMDLRDYLLSPLQTLPQSGTDVKQTKTSDQLIYQNLPPHYGPENPR